MRPLKIIPKHELTDAQLGFISKRIADPEHVNDCGPCRVWDIYAHDLYAVIEDETQNIIGLIEASGPKNSVAPGWWIDYLYRGNGYGKALVFTLADYLKQQGYTGVGYISIQGHLEKYDKASRRVRDYFIERFNSNN